MKNQMKIEFKSLSINEAFARTAVIGFFAELDPTIEELAEIKTSISEAVSNAIIHGYNNDPDKTVIVECSYEENGKIVMSVEDKGVGIADVKKNETTALFRINWPWLGFDGTSFASPRAIVKDLSK